MQSYLAFKQASASSTPLPLSTLSLVIEARLTNEPRLFRRPLEGSRVFGAPCKPQRTSTSTSRAIRPVVLLVENGGVSVVGFGDETEVGKVVDKDGRVGEDGRGHFDETALCDHGEGVAHARGSVRSGGGSIGVDVGGRESSLLIKFHTLRGGEEVQRSVLEQRLSHLVLVTVLRQVTVVLERGPEDDGAELFVARAWRRSRFMILRVRRKGQRCEVRLMEGLRSPPGALRCAC